MNNYLKLFFQRIFKDLKQKQLLPLKLLFFINASTIFVLYPYLTIHMRELGINVEETAIMSAITPVVGILMPPIAGLIADKIGNFKIMLAAFSTVGGVSALLLMLVPVGRIRIQYPDEVIFGVSCTSGSPLKLSMFQEHPCIPKELNRPYETELKIEACGFVCHAVTDPKDSLGILNTKNYGVQMHNIKANTTTTLNYELNPKHTQQQTWSSKLTFKKLTNNVNYLSSIRRFSKNAYFFPTPTLFNFSCGFNKSGVVGDSSSCLLGSKDQLVQLLAEPRFTFPNKIGISFQNQSVDDEDENKQIYAVNYVTVGDKKGAVCLDGFPKNKEFISVSIPLQRENGTEFSRTLDLGSCAPRCIATSPRTNVCSNLKSVIELDIKVTFWSYLAVRIFLSMISGTAFSMFEGAVIAILREHKADYGLQRIYATIGGMVSSPLSGWLIDFASRGKDYTDYRPIFYLYAILKILSSILMLFMDLKFKTPSKNIISDVFLVLKKVELIGLLITCFVLGTAWGYIESFLFWLIQDLGGSKSLMGITITVGGIAGIPLLVLSGPIIKRIGHANVIFIGFIFYAIRLFGYSVIYDPWLCLIFEAMESITSSLSFTAAVTYGARLSSVQTDTSIQGMIGGLYFGVGKGSGSLIGGYLMKSFGTRATFRIFSVGTAVTGIIYFLFNYFYVRKRPSEGRDITKKDSIKPNEDRIETISSVIKETPLPYEDAFTNMGFEEPELEKSEDKIKA